MNTKSKSIKPLPLIRQLGIYERGFWQLPRNLGCDTRLTPLEKDILSILLTLYQDKDSHNIKDGVSPSQAYLAEWTGSIPNSISRALIRLEKKGYLTIEQRGLNIPNIYRLTI